MLAGYAVLLVDSEGIAVHHVALHGEYDITRRDEVASLFGTLSPDGPASVDMAGVSYVDSTFLRELATLHARFREQPITLVGVTGGVRRILSIVNFDQLFVIA